MSEINNTSNDMNEEFSIEMADSTVITVPIDDSLTREGEAADAKAVGDALARKADADSVNNIDVNNQEADNQGHIILTAEHVPMSESDSTTVKAKIQAVDGKTGETIPLTAEQGAPSIAEAFNGIGAQNATTIPMSTAQGAQTIAQKIAEMETAAEGMVKSVNSEVPDENGNVEITEVPAAQNLTSDSSQTVVGDFILRTTGGSRSVGSGDAQIQEIRGAMQHTGEVQEVLDISVSEESEITAEVDGDTWKEEIDTSGTYVFSYDGSVWKLNGDTVDLNDYGITVEGTPENGDTVTVTYVKENRGLITPATPTAFRATGWNLFNPSVGYARVAKYDGAYHIGGAFTGIQFSATLNGERSALTVQNGSFTVPGDGFVWVTGGNATTTYITTEWTDWTTGPTVDWEAYSETTISMAAIMTANFPYGLLAVGAIYDSISIDQGRAISRIERLDWDEDTLAEIIDEGRAYDVDENYIYVVRTSPVSTTISLNGQFTANDHGIEIIDGTEVAPVTMILYGQNLKAKLTNDVLTISAQQLTDAQKAQARENIGVTSLLNGAIVVELKTVVDNLSIGTNTFNESSYSVAKEGYTPIGVLGFNVGNASNSGSGRTSAVFTKLYVSNGNLTACVKNVSTTSAIKVKLNVYIIYKKNGVFD